jgi:hypothetical protein
MFLALELLSQDELYLVLLTIVLPGPGTMLTGSSSTMIRQEGKQWGQHRPGHALHGLRHY